MALAATIIGITITGAALAPALGVLAISAGVGAGLLSVGPCLRGSKMACGGLALSGTSAGFGVMGMVTTRAAIAAGTPIGYNFGSALFGAGGWSIDQISYRRDYGSNVSGKC